jgi:hypothetical protein
MGTGLFTNLKLLMTTGGMCGFRIEPIEAAFRANPDVTSAVFNN